MKKNILAPAVALSLGLTGSLGAIAAPAFADETEKKTTLKSADAAGGDKTDENAGDDTKVTVSKDKLTASEYSSDGVTITLEGGEPGGEYFFRIQKDGELVEGAGGRKTADDKGEVSINVVGNADAGDDLVGTYAVDVFYPAGPRGVGSLEYTVTKDGDEEQPGDGPKATVSKDKLTASEYSSDGVTIALEGGDPGKEYTFSTRHNDGAPEEATEKADDNGKASVNVVGNADAGDDLAGTYTVEVVDTENSKKVAELEYTVTKDDEQPGDDPEVKDPALNLSEKKVNAADFVNEEKGLKAVVSNLEPGTEVTFNVAGTSGNAKNVRPFKQTVKADKDGNAVFSIKGISEDDASAYLGKYTVTAEFDDQKLEGSFEVVSGKGSGSEEEEAPAKDPALSLSEKKVKAADFVNEKKGLTAVVSNLKPGTKVTFYVGGVTGNAKNVKPYETTVTADEDGNAILSIAGTTSKDNPSVYLGKYKVTAEFDDQKLEDSFEVVSGKSSDAGESEETGSGGGSVSGGASDNVSGSTTSGSSDYLPRTGQGLGALAAGAALLTVGGATVLFTRRTRKA
ncbi:hypothetical protein MHJ85_08765 [Brevibacterium ravenspurgense]|uniref:hypothetical protein n=1 Tax=Brevibacterium ravenspurgense TaxID=479117 RepID=UPI001EF207B3|nr:hypothetical protein [Brevibacterium ravenspurgense]MCG7301346.1 hypothetical protein [Brevibacterium ravenspurgense]